MPGRKETMHQPDDDKPSLDDVFAESIQQGIPHQSPVQPQQLGLDNEFRFHCHRRISCFNACCKSIDIILMPYDILRLKRHLGIESRELVGRYTVPFEMDAHGLPGLKLATQSGSTACVFLTEDGCGVYHDRPTACRYYALGYMGMRKIDTPNVDDVFFIVKEPHCQGHQENKIQTVCEYRIEQGLERYDEMNRQWRDIIIKKRSSGPTVGQPTTRSMQLFDMCSYDLDSFREFIQGEGFSQVFDLPEEELSTLLDHDEQLLHFAMRFLKQILYGEQTIAQHQNAREVRLARRRERRGAQAPTQNGAVKQTDPG